MENMDMQAYMYKKDKKTEGIYPPPPHGNFLILYPGVGSGIKRVGIRVFES